MFLTIDGIWKIHGIDDAERNIVLTGNDIPSLSFDVILLREVSRYLYLLIHFTLQVSKRLHLFDNERKYHSAQRARFILIGRQ